MNIVQEEWRPVKGFEGKYEVSNAGQVKVLAHTVRHWCGNEIPKPERILSQSRHSGGYMLVAINGRETAIRPTTAVRTSNTATAYTTSGTPSRPAYKTTAAKATECTSTPPRLLRRLVTWCEAEQRNRRHRERQAFM
jgi:hypothetical protein